MYAAADSHPKWATGGKLIHKRDSEKPIKIRLVQTIAGPLTSSVFVRASIIIAMRLTFKSVNTRGGCELKSEQ